MEYLPPKEPDDYYRAKLAAFHDAQDQMREFFTVKEAPPPMPELTRAERRRARRTKHHLKGLRP